MAVKKSKPAEAEATPSPAPKAAAKKPEAAKAKPAAASVASDTASKAQTPKPSPVAKAPAAAAAAPKKAAAPAIKLTENQVSFLKQIQGAEAGYLSAKKAEGKTIEKLEGHKLIKKGSKDKDSGNYRYMVSKAGEKFLSSHTSP